jgi:hypothetical protein
MTKQLVSFDDLWAEPDAPTHEPVTITYGVPGVRSIEFSADPATGTISIFQESDANDEPTFTTEEFGLIVARSC